MNIHPDQLSEIAESDSGTQETREFRIFGPPGTGKTTNLTRQIHRAVDRFGPESVLVTSFSRAAAAELAGRDLPIGAERVGTLHSHCWHALGGPQIAEAHVADWNKDHPHIAITPQKRQGRLDGEEAVEDDADATLSGDMLLEQLSRFRGLMLPRSSWPAQLLQFEKLWSEYKEGNGLQDFTDLIEKSLNDVAIAPRNPAVIFADEAQDLNRMQLSLVRKWGERASYFVVAGDDDQTIFSFAGATPEAFLDPDIPEDHKIILKQSYRVPRAVHTLAEDVIRKVTRRQPKTYLPRDVEGLVYRHTAKNCTYKTTEYEILKSVEQHLAEGKDVMFLASCSYMLRPLVAMLRQRGIPFHNPYRRSNGYWNPIRIGNRVSSATRVLSLLIAHPAFGDGHRPWSNGELAQWAEVLQAKGVLRHGVKTKLKRADVTKPATMERLDEVFEPAALDSLMEAWEGDYTGLLEWWRARVTSDMADRVKYPVQIAAKRGPQALLDRPQVIVGTIHSVKGGQADCSPPDEPVLTTTGYVPIGKLDPTEHRLVSYTAHTDKIRRGVVRNASRRDQAGYGFKIASRPYCGELLTIKTASSTTRVTPNHHLIVRWSEAAKAKFVVYLMRRGDWWRVGQCQMSYGGHWNFGIGGRAKHEGADSAWILSVHETRAEAALREALTSSRYGIPMQCFRAGTRNRSLSQEELNAIHQRLSGYTQAKALELLFQSNRDINYPVYKFRLGKPGNGYRVGPQHRFVVRASNLIPDLMEIPVFTDSLRPKWEPITVEPSHYEGRVYSLQVDPYHYYVSGGAVVHNCVYVFPDLSQAGDAQYARGGAARDTVVRLFYVAITRASERLYICQRETPLAISI